jgi:hypothetical protein
VTPNTDTGVRSTVTFANNGTAVENANVNVTGAGVSVADQTTGSNGNATFTVNASSAGTITLNATLAGTNAGQSTISVGQLDSLNVGLSPNSVTANTSTAVTATVTNASSGNGVQGADVSISGQDSNTTDANGEAVLTVNASSANDLTVNVAGPAGFNDTSTGLTVNSDNIPPNAVYNDPNSVPAQFDNDNSGTISQTELGNAGQEYLADNLNQTQLGEVGQAYLAS